MYSEEGGLVKIAIYSTTLIPASPDLEQYGGLEIICGNLAKYYDDLGHDVSLFGPVGSYVPKHGKLYASGQPGQFNEYQAWDNYWAVEESRKALQEADVVHDHSWMYCPYLKAKELKALCKTHHGPDPGFRVKPPVDKPNLIAVSPNHAKHLTMFRWKNPDGAWAPSMGCVWRGVNNGIDLEKYPFKKEKGDYYLWISRIFPFKGTHRFINICNKMQVKGIIAGGSFGDDAEYLNMVKKQLSESHYVTKYGEIGTDSMKQGMVATGISHKEKVSLYQNAKAVIIPATEMFPTVDGKNEAWFIEPFGLIIPEANACFTAGTLVNTPTGMREIETLTRGDVVLDSLGFPTRIISPTKRHYRGRLFSIKIRGNQYLNVTEDHPLLCREGGYPRWMKIGELNEGDFALTPILPWSCEATEIDGKSKRKDSTIKSIKLDEAFAELLGWYCADGYPSGEDAISFSLGTKEDDIARVEFLIRRFGLSTWQRKDGNCINIVSGSPILRRIMTTLCGKGAFHKHIPEVILFGEPSLANSFLYGYFCGDGHKDKDTSIVYTTVSNNLSRQTALLATRLGLYSSVGMHTRNNTTTDIRGHTAHQRKTLYRVRLYGVDLDHENHKLKQTLSPGSNQRFFDEFGLWSPIEVMYEQPFEGDVFNIHTIRGTYLAENIAVHNCGTPVIVTPSGGWQSSLRHGINGFFANSNDEFIFYMKRIEAGEIKPEDCRKVAEEFSYQRMGEEYLRLYKEIIEGRGW